MEFAVILKISLMVYLKVIIKYYLAETEKNHDEY